MNQAMPDPFHSIIRGGKERKVPIIAEAHIITEVYSPRDPVAAKSSRARPEIIGIHKVITKFINMIKIH